MVVHMFTFPQMTVHAQPNKLPRAQPPKQTLWLGGESQELHFTPSLPPAKTQHHIIHGAAATEGYHDLRRD